MPIYKHVDEKFFDAWSECMAYVLGFLMADGSLDTNPRGGEYLSLQITDKVLLEAIRDVLQSEHKIALRPGKGNEKDLYRMQIGNKAMCAQLRKLGMHERKAHTMELPNIPQEFFCSFIRGYFDGDGNVWVGSVHKERKTSLLAIHTGFTSCSKGFLTSLRNELHMQGLGVGSLVHTSKAYRLQYSINDSILLYRLMYASVSGKLELPRKRRVFERYIAMRS